ncbi:MAG: ATP-dependent helicase, partial [Gammaproteobacteria bacterium]|nr:ATP-dependent helicase [Gammaproteobacteria bacterium]
GFIEDVEGVREQIPGEHQPALFSATMPNQIRKITETYLKKPVHVSIKEKTTTAGTVRQRYWMVSGLHKLDALTRILEVEKTDGIIIFARTKIMTTELAEKLSARGFAATALNGDIPQKTREQTINKLKTGKLDILVATDVAARGLDVPRISHVINYDVPHDTESYVHRVGRTGRAGRPGDAILFIAPREKRMLFSIERATRQKIEQMALPTPEAIKDHRIAHFKQRITDTLAKEEQLEFYAQVIDSYRIEHDIPALEIAAALASLLQGDTPLLVKKERPQKQRKQKEDRPNPRREERRPSADKKRSRKKESHELPSELSSKSTHKPKSPPPAKVDHPPRGMERYRLAVGQKHEAKVDQIVGAIANVAGLYHEDIGKVTIHDQHSTIDLPQGMPRDIFRELRKTWVSGQKLQISREERGESSRSAPPHKQKSKKQADPKIKRGKKGAKEKKRKKRTP